MKICLIAEGSYPYVTGGVSSWIQMLVSNMSEHEFIIIAISANKNENHSYKYEIILKFIIGEYFEWKDFFDCMKRLKNINTVDILMSEDFFDVISEVATKYYPYIVFNHFFGQYVP